MKIKDLPKTLRVPLQRALSVKRPSGSKEEAEFRAWLAVTYKATSIDEAGNIHIVKGENPTTCFAAHTDTCHHSGGINKYREADGVVYAESECLGADDGAGVAILCHMLSCNVPGYYIFTTAEEVGGVGATYIRDSLPEVFESIQRSVCFDRAGTSEIITVQGGERLASSEFAEALSQQFAECDLLYSESTKGVFTDNALWGRLIPENINLGVAYTQQHGPNETLDLNHFGLLAIAAVRIDWESLPTSRVPQKEKYGVYKGSTTYDDMDPLDSWPGSTGESTAWDEDELIALEDAVHLALKGQPTYLQGILTAQLAEITGVTFDECVKFVYVNKLKLEILEELDWGQSFETIVDDLLTIAAPEIM